MVAGTWRIDKDTVEGGVEIDRDRGEEESKKKGGLDKEIETGRNKAKDRGWDWDIGG